MIIKPDGRIELQHRAYFLGGTPKSSITIAASKEGQVSVLSPDLINISEVRLSSEIRSISSHPSERLFAWLDDRGLLTVQTDSEVGVNHAAPAQLTADGIKTGFQCCHFDVTGEFLWLVSLPADGSGELLGLSCRPADEYEIQLIETGSWTCIKRVTVADPFFESSCFLQDTGRRGLLSLWLAAGQDGQQTYWLEQNRSGLACRRARQLRNTMPPVFSPSGEYLVVVKDRAICKFRFPDMKQVGCLDSADIDASSLCFLDEKRVLVGTSEGRMFVIDTARMKLEEEVFLEGHEPRPICQYYPTLENQTWLATDISSFWRLGDVIFFACRRDGGTDLASWMDTLLWLSVKDH